MKAASVLVLFLLSSGVLISDAAWCVCKSDQQLSALQTTLDYACGAGANCGAILQNGPCYNPNTVVSHCSYAVNSYFQAKGQASGSCDFHGTATTTTTDPSYSGCAYPSSSTAAGTGSTPAGAGSTPTSAGSTAAPGTANGSSTSIAPPGAISGTGTSTGMGGGAARGLGPTSPGNYEGNSARGLRSASSTFAVIAAVLTAICSYAFY